MPLPDNFSARAFDRCWSERELTADEAEMIEASERAAAILRTAREQLAQLPPITHWHLLSLDDAIDTITSLVERFDGAEERIRNDIDEEAF